MLSALLTLAIATLPERIVIKTHDQSFSWENDYALKDGKLWVKPNPLGAGIKGEWALFDGTGVPGGKKAASFRSDSRLVAFATEGLMVAAVSDEGRFYFWQPTLFEQPTVWHDEAGQPLAGPLLLPPHRDWTFSLSVAVAPKKRLTPMHDIDAYWEDLAGNKIEFGFTATIYVLDPDGQRIRFWDTGLPPAFYKAFATPERGRFIAERIAASGSTVFVVDKSGKMFTRMFDYEMFGACPGLRFTFENKRRTKNADEVLSLFEAERTLPLPSWREQPPLPLEGKAQATTAISIHMTGKGNAARELRVRGRDASGRYGYFFKPVFGEKWSFAPTEERFDDAVAIANPAPARVLGRPLDKTYAGQLKQEGAAALPVELRDFYYYETPATLRVNAGGKTLDLTLHTFDGWGPTVEQSEHPSLVGSAFGEPKLLLATLEIPAALLNSTDPAVKQVIDLYFRRFHRAHLALSVSADDRKVELRTRAVQRTSTEYLDYTVRTPIELTATRDIPPDELKAYDQTNLVHLTADPSLRVDEAHADAAALDAALERNRALLAAIRKQELDDKLAHAGHGALAGAAGAVFVPANALVSALGVPRKQALVGGLSMTGGELLFDYASMNVKMVVSTPDDYKRAVGILDERIRHYEGLRARLPHRTP
jgi:hypothetical protein